MYPMKMIPAYKNYLWGGKKLNKYFNKQSIYNKTAESWELSCCDDGLSVIANGFFKNKTLKEVLLQNHDFLGSNAKNLDRFPLLIKLIDAYDKLSIQVHPSDESADQTKGQQGKTEMWYILDCDKDAFLYLGFRENISKNQLENAITSGDICDYLNKIFVKPGDVFFISPGTVHAIGAGILIAEIQQNSNTTFRIFDYNRIDNNGKKRQLHINDSIRVSDTNKYLNNKQSSKLIDKTLDYELNQLIVCDYFKVFKYDVKTKIKLHPSKKSFQALLFVDGEGMINYNSESYRFQKGDCYFIPANIDEYQILGNCQCLISEI